MSPPIGAVTNRLPFIAASLAYIISRPSVFVKSSQGDIKAAVPYEIARSACLRVDSRPPLLPFTLVHKTIVPRRVMWYNTLDTL